eukprot:Ihof_evm4s179 gene=Ihof_evmTU4s179
MRERNNIKGHKRHRSRSESDKGAQQSAIEREEEEEMERKLNKSRERRLEVQNMWNKTLKGITEPFLPFLAEKLPECRPNKPDLKNIIKGEAFQQRKELLKVMRHRVPMKVINRQHERFGDFYIALLNATWSFILIVLITSLIGLSFGFFLMYTRDINGLEGHHGSYIAVFLFSLSQSTLSGSSPITTVSTYNILVANLHGLISQLYFVFLTGILFTRLSLPSAAICASEKLIINFRPKKDKTSQHKQDTNAFNNGKNNIGLSTRVPRESIGETEYGSVLARIVITRVPPVMIDANFFLTFAHPVITHDGLTIMKLEQLPLVRSYAPMWRYSMLIRHIITDDSPLVNYTRERLYEEGVSFYIT